MSRLAGKVAIVTGGAKGIGRHYSQALAAAGARVMIADIADGRDVADEIAAKSGANSAASFKFDVSDEAQVKALVAQTIERFGQIDVLVHPQSLVHALVEFQDGSTLAQMGLPDMRTALAVGLGWPERIASGVAGLDLLQHGRLEFEPPDLGAFPCLALAYQALAAGGTAPAVLNAANEVAVSSFLQGRTAFLGIPALVEDCLAALPATAAPDLDTLLAADAAARAHAGRRIAEGAYA